MLLATFGYAVQLHELAMRYGNINGFRDVLEMNFPIVSVRGPGCFHSLWRLRVC